MKTRLWMATLAVIAAAAVGAGAYAWQPSIIEGLITGISNGRTQEDRPRHWGGIVFTRIVETSHDLSLL